MSFFMSYMINVDRRKTPEGFNKINVDDHEIKKVQNAVSITWFDYQRCGFNIERIS